MTILDGNKQELVASSLLEVDEIIEGFQESTFSRFATTKKDKNYGNTGSNIFMVKKGLRYIQLRV